MSDAKLRTIIVVNPKAREGRVGDRWPEIERDLMGALGEKQARVAFTTATDFGSGIVRAALHEGFRRIVVVGGDGTISEAVQGFFENGHAIAPDATLAIMPAGRGDDFFKMLIGERQFSSRDVWEKGLEVLRRGRSQPSDMGEVEFLAADGRVLSKRYFINIADVGYPGLVVERVQKKKGWMGKGRIGRSALTYVLQSAAAMLEYKPVNGVVTIDGVKVHDGPLYSGFVLNGAYNAGGVRWSHELKIDDGLFHVVLFEPRPVVAALGDGARMLSGNWQGVKGVSTRTGRVVEWRLADGVEAGHRLIDVDGDLPEPVGTRGARFTVLPGALRIWR